MLARAILGVVGIAGLAAGVWMIVYNPRRGPESMTFRQRAFKALFELDSAMYAFGWATWMGLFGGLLSFSITGQTIV